MIPGHRTSFLSGNLRSLSRRCPATFSWLSDHQERIYGVEENLIENRWGRLDWRLPSGKGLFETMTPEIAYRDWVPQDEPEMGATLIVGSNLGYGVNRVLSGTGDAHSVWVLEPRPEMLVSCLSQTDYRPFLDSGRLSFLPPDTGYLKRIIWQWDVEYVFGKVFMLADLPSHQISSSYAIWAERCKTILDSFGADLNTLRLNQDRMVQNELQNYARSMDDGNIFPLQGQGRGVPAVIYGAGPSLDHFAPSLAEQRSSALHVCGLQVLPALYRYGLKPHFCMAIDYTEAMRGVCQKLDRKWARDIPLIYSRKVSPQAVEAYPGPTLPIWTVGGIGTFLPREREVVLNGGGSVSVALTRFLAWCGIRRLLLVGFDFSWKGERTHVLGHLAEKRRFCFDPQKHLVMTNKHGDMVHSEAAYLTALKDLEGDLQEGSVTVYNLYGGGLRIKGAPEVSWKEVLERNLLSARQKQLEHFLKTLKAVRTPRMWPRLEARSVEWRKSLRAVANRIGKLSQRHDMHHQQIRAFLSQIIFFLKQDPLYQPYLFNEILEIARMSREGITLGQKDWSNLNGVLERIQSKVTEVDACVIDSEKRAA